MTRDSDRRLSAARPEGPDPSGREAMFARIVARRGAPDDIEASVLVPRPHRLSRGTVFAGAAVIAVVAGIGVPIALDAGAGSARQGSGADLRLAAYTLRLPAAYRLTGLVPEPCAPVLVAYAGRAARAQVHTRRVASAVAGGHCISMRLLGPFRSTGSRTATVSAVVGPVTESWTAQVVKVGPNQALLATFRAQAGIAPGSPGDGKTVNGRVLDVILPSGNGQSENLVITSVGMSPGAFLALVAANLSTAAPPGVQWSCEKVQVHQITAVPVPSASAAATTIVPATTIAPATTTPAATTTALEGRVVAPGPCCLPPAAIAPSPGATTTTPAATTTLAPAATTLAPAATTLAPAATTGPAATTTSLSSSAPTAQPAPRFFRVWAGAWCQVAPAPPLSPPPPAAATTTPFAATSTSTPVRQP
jgi:hypothetical protein